MYTHKHIMTIRKCGPVPLVLLFVLFSSTVFGQTSKYDIKSGIITFDYTIMLGKTKLTNKTIVYFDEYGMKECKEEYEGKELKKSFFSDGKTLYTVIHATKTAFKRGNASRGTELRFGMTEEEKGTGKTKKLDNIIVAGKTCESFERRGTSDRTVFAGWNHIVLLTDYDAGTMKSTTRAVSVQENVKVPPDKFMVPAGYKVQQSTI
jgi:hypothetical protein